MQMESKQKCSKSTPKIKNVFAYDKKLKSKNKTVGLTVYWEVI